MEIENPNCICCLLSILGFQNFGEILQPTVCSPPKSEQNKIDLASLTSSLNSLSASPGVTPGQYGPRSQWAPTQMSPPVVRGFFSWLLSCSSYGLQ